MLSICCSNHILEKLKKSGKKINNVRYPSGKNYPSEKDDWKRFEKNNPMIALNVLYIKNVNIYLSQISKKRNTKKETLNHEKWINTLMILNKEGWNYLAAKKSSSRGIALKHDDDFYCLNCLPSFRTKK